MSHAILNYQAGQLLAEFITIIDNKWPILNGSACACVKEYFRLAAQLNEQSTASSDDDEPAVIDDNSEPTTGDSSVVGFATLKLIRETNQQYETMLELITSFEFYAARLRDLCAKLLKLSNVQLSTPSSLIPSYTIADIGQLLGTGSVAYENEFKLKSQLVKDGLMFRARFRRDRQVSIICCLMHQPYLKELTELQLKTRIGKSPAVTITKK